MKRWRTAVGSLGILVFIAIYVWVAMLIGQHLPNQPLARLAYYVAAGLLWIFPLMPAMKWMARDDADKIGLRGLEKQTSKGR